MMRASRLHLLTITTLLVALGGCASVPQATPERDAEAKQFITHPGFASIYIFRIDFGGNPSSEDPVVHVDGRLIGATLPRTYFRVDVLPGERLLHGIGYDQGSIKINVRPDEITFVSLDAMGGTSHFKQVDPETGKREILRCCSLMENWAPGLRPLFR